MLATSTSPTATTSEDCWTFGVSRRLEKRDRALRYLHTAVGVTATSSSGGSASSSSTLLVRSEATTTRSRGRLLLEWWHLFTEIDSTSATTGSPPPQCGARADAVSPSR